MLRLRFTARRLRRAAPLTCGVFLCVFAQCSSPAYGHEIYLKNGDRLTGEIVSENADQVVVEHPLLGSVAIAAESIERIVRDEPQDEALVQASGGKKEKLWSGEAELGYNLRRGNTDNEQLLGGFSANRKTDRNEFTAGLDGYYSASGRVMDAQRYSGMIRYAFSFGQRLAWYNFYKAEASHDRFADINWRFTPSSGMGYWFSDRPEWKAMAEIGVGWERTNFRDVTANRSEVVLVPRGFAEKALLGDATLSQDLVVWPNMSDFGEFRLRSETSLTNPLAGHVALRMSLIDEYQSNPASNVHKNDARFLSSLVYSF